MNEVRVRRIRPLAWLAGVPRSLRGRATFGLSTLLIALTIIGIVFGVIGHRRERVRAAYRLVDSRFGYVRGQPPNVTVELEMSDLRGVDLDLLRYLPDVKVLRLASAKIDREGFRAIGRLATVQELNLSFVEQLADGDLDLLLGMSELRTLSINRTGCTLAGLAKLSALPNLRALVIDGLAGDELALDGFPQLERIGGISQGLKRVSISRMPQLRSINLRSGTADVYLADLPMLGDLRLYSSSGSFQLTGAPSLQIARLAALPALARLDLHGTGLTDEDCEQLAQMKHLNHLSIVDMAAQISEEGIRRLASSDGLQRLDLLIPSLTDASIVDLSRRKFRERRLGAFGPAQDIFVRPDEMRSFSRP